jgi:hypothetical protein
MGLKKYTKVRKARINGKTERKNPKLRFTPIAAKSGIPPSVVFMSPPEAAIITITRGMAPIILDAIKGITEPTRYLQKAFFPLKGAVKNVSSSLPGVMADSNVSIYV